MAINHAAINSVYNYYLTTYAPKSTTKFDTHKKSELRSVYNSMVKMNKESPLYIVDRSQDTKEYAIGLKENARAFRNTIASLGGLSQDEMLYKKTAYSSNESIATATYIGENTEDATAPSFTLEVNKLASPQTNLGKMIPSDKLFLAEDTYSFDIGISGLNYEFQYNVHDNDTNISIQNKLARLITKSGIGLKADVVEDDNGNSALRIASMTTGASSDDGPIFSVTDNNTSKASGSVGYFGLDYISAEASDATFLVNGEERHSSSNTFTVEKTYEITLTGLSPMEGETTTIDMKADTESIAMNISKLIEGYNAFVETADKYSENHPKSGRLVREMSTLASLHQDELEGIGIKLQDNGRISLDKDLLQRVTVEDELKNHFTTLKNFAGSMLNKTNQVSLNPMHYADKTVVAYKNPGHNFASPYITSAYSGMLFNSYC